ncbi:hypothetical protein [Cytophaga aurantiaca]|uniref:hypothetical protein n=1 Tax=Cytophaga aurantiaca TaxID=29530 RepID=UPI00035E0F8D|nr:hypothetical protein [Cytophaga aurantiaca]
MSSKCKLFLKKVLKIYKTWVKIKLNKIQFDINSAGHAVFRRIIFNDTTKLNPYKKLNLPIVANRIIQKMQIFSILWIYSKVTYPLKGT